MDKQSVLHFNPAMLEAGGLFAPDERAVFFDNLLWERFITCDKPEVMELRKQHQAYTVYKLFPEFRKEEYMAFDDAGIDFQNRKQKGRLEKEVFLAKYPWQKEKLIALVQMIDSITPMRFYFAQHPQNFQKFCLWATEVGFDAAHQLIAVLVQSKHFCDTYYIHLFIDPIIQHMRPSIYDYCALLQELSKGYTLYVQPNPSIFKALWLKERMDNQRIQALRFFFSSLRVAIEFMQMPPSAIREVLCVAITHIDSAKQIMVDLHLKALNQSLRRMSLKRNLHVIYPTDK